MRLDFSQYRDVLAPQFAAYLEHEPGATRILNYQPREVAGWLQTDEYMLALNRGIAEPATPADTTARRVEVRRARRQLLDTAKLVHIILDEAVFWRQALPDHPSPQVMRAQIEHLRQAAAARAHLTIQVLPFDRSILRGDQGPFTVLECPDRSLVYREGADSEALSFDPARVEVYESNFARASQAAISLDTYLAQASGRRAPAWLTSDGSA